MFVFWFCSCSLLVTMVAGAVVTAIAGGNLRNDCRAYPAWNIHWGVYLGDGLLVVVGIVMAIGAPTTFFVYLV